MEFDIVESTLENVWTMVTIGSGFGLYFYKSWRIKKQERQQASGSLYRELEDTRVALNRKMNLKDALDYRGNDGKTYYFMHRTLNHDFYDSLVFSGKINYLHPKIQQKVQDVFRTIKLHNKYIDLVMYDDNPMSPKLHKYIVWMDKHEKLLLDEIPRLQEKIRKEFNLDPQKVLAALK